MILILSYWSRGSFAAFAAVEMCHRSSPGSHDRRLWRPLGPPAHQIILVIVPATPVITDLNPSKARRPVFIARLDPLAAFYHISTHRGPFDTFPEGFSPASLSLSPLSSYAWLYWGVGHPYISRASDYMSFAMRGAYGANVLQMYDACKRDLSLDYKAKYWKSTFILKKFYPRNYSIYILYI